MKNILYLIYIAFLISLYLPLGAQNIFDQEHSERYASHLFENKEFHEAADEYERLIQMAPDNYHYRENLLLSYNYSIQYSKGINRTEALFGKSFSDYPPVIIENYLQMLILQNNCDSCIYIFSEKLNMTKQIKDEFELANYLLNKQFENANSLISSYDSLQSERSVKFLQLSEIFSEIKKTHYKRPIIASVLSIILPGAGKAYANDFENGALAFSIIALYAWQSYRAFSNDGTDSFYGWLFAVAATGFYIGNIYGSYRSAERENNYHERLIDEHVKKIILSGE